MARWVAAEEAKRTWRTFRADWLAIPRERRKRFAMTLTLAWAVAGALVIGLTYGMQSLLSPELEAAEREWLERLVDSEPIPYSLAVYLESPGNGPIIMTATFLTAIFFSRRHRPLWALSVLASTLMVGAVVLIGWFLWERERPDFLYEGLPASSVSAFPSGHTSMALPFYGFLAYLWIRGSPSYAERLVATFLLLGGMATMLLAQLVLGVHWPSDLAGGAVLGAFWLAALIAALRQGEERGADAEKEAPAASRQPEGNR
jgi:membrane-associated phospholipid phosphatase